ncbi:MAG: sensor histidine kinase [Desulfobacteraceae bacterium]|nr:sensor histidine kinase [Desulfobacteraceae bacterium]
MFHLRKKISHKLLFAFFLVAVIPISIIGFSMYRTAERTLIDSAYTHVQTIAQNHANRLDTWYGERLNDIKVLTGLSAVRDYCTMACGLDSRSMRTAKSELVDNFLALTRAKSPAYQSIHVITPSGGILASTDTNSEIIVSKRYLEDLKSLMHADGPVLSPVHQHSNLEWYLHLTVPIYFESGDIGAGVMAILDALGTLDPLLADRTGLGNTGEAYLVNEEGKIVTRSRYLSPEQTSAKIFETVGIVSALDRKNGIALYRNYMGREVVGSYTWIPRFHAALLVEIEKDEILAPLEGIKVAALLTAGTVSLVCILFSLLLSRQISRPITQIAEASRRFSSGELAQRISCSGQDEVGTLSESFNSMAEKLSILIESLKLKEASLQKAYDDLLQTKEQLVQSEKMAAVGELVASVVHEIRNPLSSVKLNFQIIGRTLDKEGPLHEHYAIGLSQIAQLEKMFSSLLDYSKPITLERVPFEIKSVIEQSICQISPYCREDMIILLGIDDPLPSVFGDPGKIQQVIVNVVKNAMESAGAGAKIEIRASAIDAEQGKELLLEIKDNGPGISEQDLDRIFLPFFTTKQKGTGLGLSIVKKIMEAHAFGISVSSQEGAGTVVSMHLRGA